jgi:uncharacterized lipoprotein YbaY
MKFRSLIFCFTLLFISATAFGQAAWLDRPLTTNWNTGSGVVPTAPRMTGSTPNSDMCRSAVRAPESIADRAVTRAGWFLYGPSQTYGATTVITAMASVDGMCRPNQHNGFVFVANRFAGTLSPTPTDARSDGALGLVRLFGPTELSAEFARYTSSDPLCCPSQTSTVRYSVGSGARAAVIAEDVSTSAVCQDQIQTMDNVVSGTVTYRQRIALPQTAILTVQLLDVTRQDASAPVIAEQRIETAGKQVPFSFDLAYDRRLIQERGRYAIRAEIIDGGRLLFTTDASYPVITQGNPRSVEIVLASVGGGGRGTGTGVGSASIRGTVTYRQRIALGPNSEITVKLVDSSNPAGTPVSESSFSSGNRQVPIPFELRYEPRDINRQRNYELRAEIRTDGVLRFRTEQGQPVNLIAGQPGNVELVLVAATEEPEAITGQNINLAKFGTGSLQIGNRGSEFIVRGGVVVRTDGTAEVTLNRIIGSITFSGKLTYFDQNTLRITVTNSGNADASGEIEVRYSGRTLNSLAGNGLVLDGQDVVLRF